jgi:hypothetical protein
MMEDLRLVASNITAALISSGAVSVKDKSNLKGIKKAVDIYSMVLTELADRDQKGNLYKNL